MAFVFRKKEEKDNNRGNMSLFDFTSADTLVKKENNSNNNSSDNPSETNSGTYSDDGSFDEDEYGFEDFPEDNSLQTQMEDSISDDSIEIPEKLKEILFPYKRVRPQQEELIETAYDCIKNKKHLIAHAPTGLGKTVSVIAPAIRHAIANNKKVMFLTSRHTQHLIAMRTANEIKDKYKINFIATDIIGKKWMCLNSAAKNANSGDFAEVCRYLRENGLCKNYIDTRKTNGLTPKAQLIVEQIKNDINDSKRIISIAEENGLCPYELSLELAKESKLIITDYYYAFNENIMENFFKRSRLSLSESIIIVDEGHNLPQRIRDQQTTKLSNIMLNRAIKEAKNLANPDIENKLIAIRTVLEEYAKELDEQTSIRNYQREEESNNDDPNNPNKKKFFRMDAEVLMRKEDFEVDIRRKFDLDKTIDEFFEIGENIRDIKNIASYIFVTGQFLMRWRDTFDESYVRILKRDQKNITLQLRCLDPSITSRRIIDESHSTILMSGTLNPTSMYRDVLGFDEERTIEKTFENPFPKKNRINMIIPKTSTKYEQRSPEQFQRIANVCVNISNEVRGNSIIFFPSYDILKKVYSSMEGLKKTVLVENSEMTREERFEVIEKFKSYKDSGAVLLGVQAGSFSEGIDLPGDYLKCVIVVGLPLQRPNIETRQLINYLDIKFGKGWDYGYVFPAFSKILQSAGRCIRSEHDRGVIVFLDERFAWPNYVRCFPPDWKLEIEHEYLPKIERFFEEQQ